jgi:small subunit ribosomal protein S14
MKKKKFNQKDLVSRFKVKKSEDQRISLKTIQQSSLLDFSNRFLASFQLSNLKAASTSFPNQIRNRCISTGRSRGVSNFFHISRIMIKDLTSRGLLPGFKKAS